MNRWILMRKVCILYRRLTMTMATASTIYRKEWRKSCQSLGKIWGQMLINRVGRRLNIVGIKRVVMLTVEQGQQPEEYYVEHELREEVLQVPIFPFVHDVGFGDVEESPIYDRSIRPVERVPGSVEEYSE